MYFLYFYVLSLLGSSYLATAGTLTWATTTGEQQQLRGPENLHSPNQKPYGLMSDLEMFKIVSDKKKYLIILQRMKWRRF